MSNPNNFAGGFFLGAVVGGVLGGILGATLVSRRSPSHESTTNALKDVERDERRAWDTGRKRVLSSSSEPDFEITRRGLEDKIAQLNDAIDAARQQLGNSREGVEETAFHRAGDWEQPRNRLTEEV